VSAHFTAQFYSPLKFTLIDMDENRLKMVEKICATDTINSAKEDVQKKNNSK
jgi:alcohol dehydrogenase